MIYVNHKKVKIKSDIFKPNKSIFYKFFYNFCYDFVFMYVKMSKNLSATFY